MVEINEGLSSTSTVTGTPVVNTKPKYQRGPLNKVLLRKLVLAENVVRSVRGEEYLAALQPREITLEYLDSLAADLKAARKKMSDGLQFGTAAKGATADHVKTQKALEAALQDVQKAAKQKYARTNRIALDDYFVSKKLNGSVPNLAQTSEAILNKLAEDLLPGMTAKKIAEIGTLRQFWVDATAMHTAHSTAAQTARAEFKTLLKSIDDRRLTVQLAADAEWPHGDEANAGIRKEFGLSPKRSVKV